MKQQVFNPYLPPWEYIPDGEPHVFDGRLYIFGSHDRFGGKWYCENDYVSWSAPVNDLSNWRYEGVIYKKDQDSRKGNLYAPDVAKGPDGRYYLYYSKDDTSVISVAVSDTPAGHYAYYGDVSYQDGRILGGSEGDYFMFDPSVLIDAGRIWLYSGSSARRTTTKIKRNMAGCTVTELSHDMKTVKTQPKVILAGTKSWLTDAYFEGPSARKIGDRYYVVYPTRNGTGLHYAVSDRPDAGFVHKGLIHSTFNIGVDGRGVADPAYPRGNSHGGLAQINGQWFIFDHRNTNGTGFSRQGVAEPVILNPDGTFRQAEATSCGLNLKPLRDEGYYPAYIACVLMSGKIFGGVRLPAMCPYVTQSGNDGDTRNTSFIANVGGGSVVGYKYFGFSGGEYEIAVTTRGDKGKLVLSTGEKDDPVGEAALRACENKTETVIRCRIEKGVRPLFFTRHGRGKTELYGLTIHKKGD